MERLRPEMKQRERLIEEPSIDNVGVPSHRVAMSGARFVLGAVASDNSGTFLDRYIDSQQIKLTGQNAVVGKTPHFSGLSSDDTVGCY